MSDHNKLQQLIDEKIVAGLPPDDAREVAQRQLEHDDKLAAEAADAARSAKKSRTAPAADAS